MRILITTGDSDGIGWEVTAKALNSIGPQKGVQFVYYRGTKPRSKPQLGRKFKVQPVKTLTEASLREFSPQIALEVQSSAAPAAWVEEAALACLRGEFQALVTGPLSKTSIVAAGFKDIGHTEILARVCGTPELFMGFRGQHFSVVLATGHRPLASAVTALNPHQITAAVAAAEKLRMLLPAAQRRLPLALVGVNPHAGELGLIGSEELWMRGLVAGLAVDTPLEGPLVPDAAFLRENWRRYSVFICPYHDQGLIPFKMIHGFSGGVHLTLGLPFVRTSVDHGTAKNIFGKNRAHAGSMKDALRTAIQLSREDAK